MRSCRQGLNLGSKNKAELLNLIKCWQFFKMDLIWPQSSNLNMFYAHFSMILFFIYGLNLICERVSEALHMIRFENFVKSISYTKLKVLPSFCFPNAITRKRDRIYYKKLYQIDALLHLSQNFWVWRANIPAKNKKAKLYNPHIKVWNLHFFQFDFSVAI